LIGPSISTAIGWKEYEAGRSAYLASFLEAAFYYYYHCPMTGTQLY